MKSASVPTGSRPSGVTILAILSILIGILGIAGGAVLLASSDVTILVLSIFAVLVGILYLATGIGFFRGDGWARMLGILVSLLSLVRDLVEAATGGVVFAIPGIVVAGIILYYLTRPEVKAWFTHGRPPEPVTPP